MKRDTTRQKRDREEREEVERYLHVVQHSLRRLPWFLEEGFGFFLNLYLFDDLLRARIGKASR